MVATGSSPRENSLERYHLRDRQATESILSDDGATLTDEAGDEDFEENSEDIGSSTDEEYEEADEFE